MSSLIMIFLTATMLATAFVSGIFGMAGGLILMGVLLVLLPLPEAMALHGVTQMASNGWRGLLWIRYVRWRAVGAFLAGSAVAFAVWSMLRYVPSKPFVFILLGLSPFLVQLVPKDLKPDPENVLNGIVYGSLSMSMMLLAGVSGPLIDTFFLGGKLDRREIVASKSACQIFSHGAKIVYFGGLVAEAAPLDPWMAGLAVAASVTGTSLARPVLDRLTDTDYRTWTARIITTIALAYIAQGVYLLVRG